jgi:hypothetical protein
LDLLLFFYLVCRFYITYAREVCRSSLYTDKPITDQP